MVLVGGFSFQRETGIEFQTGFTGFTGSERWALKDGRVDAGGFRIKLPVFSAND